LSAFFPHEPHSIDCLQTFIQHFIKITMNPAPSASDSGQEAREKAMTEANARIVWGDEPPEVVLYLRTQGFDAADANNLVKGFVKERNADIRACGIRKTVIGALCLPVAGFCFYDAMNSTSAISAGGRGGGLSIAVGLALWGLWCVINGLCMLFSPKSEHGDLAGG